MPLIIPKILMIMNVKRQPNAEINIADRLLRLAPTKMHPEKQALATVRFSGGK
jgi:hypothetical protein